MATLTKFDSNAISSIFFRPAIGWFYPSLFAKNNKFECFVIFSKNFQCMMSFVKQKIFGGKIKNFVFIFQFQFINVLYNFSFFHVGSGE